MLVDPKKDEAKKEYEEWKKKFGHDWEPVKTPEQLKEEHNKWLLEFFRGRML